MAAITDYTNLIIEQHADKPNFLAAVSATLQPFVDSLNAIQNLVATKFDLDTATGAQLDVLGQWIGLPRSLRLPIQGVFFAFDIPGLGFDQGVWSSPLNPSDGIITMDDGSYRLMLKARVAMNTWDGSLGDANAKLSAIFGTAISLRDNFDMSETFLISGNTLSQLFLSLVQQGYIQMRPATVQASSIMDKLPEGLDVSLFISTNDFVEDTHPEYFV